MIWLDRTNKKCMTVEDINWMESAVSVDITRHNEVANNHNHPIGVVNSYFRDMFYENKEGVCGGRMFCIALGFEDTRGKGGFYVVGRHDFERGETKVGITKDLADGWNRRKSNESDSYRYHRWR